MKGFPLLLFAVGVCWVLAANLKTLNGTVVVEATHDTDATEIQALVVRGEFSLFHPTHPTPPPPVPFCLPLQQALQLTLLSTSR